VDRLGRVHDGQMTAQQLEPVPAAGAPVPVDGAALLAATANVVMQLSRPEVGHGVAESTVTGAQVMHHPLRRWRTTVTYLAATLMGGPAEREACRRLIDRSHARVRSTPGSPVSYNAFDPELQLWIAACLYRGMADVHQLLHGPADDQTADALYQAASRFGSTLQMRRDAWPRDRGAFDHYWDAALARIRMDPPVRAYADQLIRLAYLPRPLGAALSPLNRFLTTGFLPEPFRELMGLHWDERDQLAFAALMRVVAAVNRLLPGPARQFPFNACLAALRAQIKRDTAHPSGRMTDASDVLP
jgi:uncharacterized protein (DUF2236 family)